jgi:hypothetical protein
LGTVYICTTPGSGIVPTVRGAHDWQPVVRVGIAWDPENYYNVDDLTVFNGMPYICTTAVPIGSPDPATDTTNWEPGTGSVGKAWTPGTDYEVGDITSEGGIVYIALNPSNGSLPSTTPADWQSLDGKNDGKYVNTTGDTMTGPLVVPAGATGNEAINKNQADGDYINVTGDTMTGPLIVPAGATGNEAINKNQADGAYVNKAGDTMTGPLNVTNATAGTHAVNRSTGDGRWVNKAGDTMTGALVLSGDATANLHPVTLQQLNNSVGGFVRKTGDTMSGQLNVPNATAGGNAVNRNTGDGRWVNKTGDTMSGTLNMGSQKVTSTSNASSDNDHVRAASYATTTRGGTIKARYSGGVLYLSNNGTNP